MLKIQCAIGFAIKFFEFVFRNSCDLVLSKYLVKNAVANQPIQDIVDLVCHGTVFGQNKSSRHVDKQILYEVKWLMSSFQQVLPCEIVESTLEFLNNQICKSPSSLVPIFLASGFPLSWSLDHFFNGPLCWILTWTMIPSFRTWSLRSSGGDPEKNQLFFSTCWYTSLLSRNGEVCFNEVSITL